MCRSSRMHAKLCAGAKDGRESHFPTLPPLSFLPLSSRIRCHHLVVEVASHGLTRPDLSHLHTLKQKHLPRPDQCSQEHTPRERWEDVLLSSTSSKEKSKQTRGVELEAASGSSLHDRHRFPLHPTFPKTQLALQSFAPTAAELQSWDKQVVPLQKRDLGCPHQLHNLAVHSCTWGMVLLSRSHHSLGFSLQGKTEEGISYLKERKYCNPGHRYEISGLQTQADICSYLIQLLSS